MSYVLYYVLNSWIDVIWIETYLQFAPLNAADAALRVPPARLGPEGELGRRQVVRAGLVDRRRNLLPPLSVCRCVLSEKGNITFVGLFSNITYLPLPVDLQIISFTHCFKAKRS